ncbi:zinc-dependent alcohol dehydrogenase [Rubellimicrobium aerolatum]|uniref:Zinc-dependent alcohol dehydrogenase n=1 Tax=Rubellimicrobium aerolatum TaxID=490979 RepID=A0ABW0S925_9RHOB|nr:zinc-dependent alcohol dehydrogenase [Rubellimicrobium aerolatum]MBP1804801.1 threonine dehydrogenase-like Zn-dependent dehydrogenase [Rubellimicrobium aerolatum]
MRALTYHGKMKVQVDSHPDPQIVNPRDAIIEVTSTAICGSDLHLFDGVIPGVLKGDILGHEFMGRVVEVGPKSTLEVGQRVVVPFTISCGACFHCRNQEFSHCDNSNPVEKQDMSETLYGHSMAGLFGYSHLTGGYPGGQAEFVRVPFSDVGPIVIPDHIPDEQALFLSDILPTGWMAADQATVEPGDTIVVWGAGPVGLFAAQSAKVMGAEQVIVIDHYPRRLALARKMGAKVIDRSQTNVLEALMEMTGGQGPDAVIDAVGMESHGFGNFNLPDTIKQKVGIGADRIGALREAITAVRKGGRVSVPGAYGGMSDKFPTGALMEKGLTLRTGQTHVQRYYRELLERIERGEIDTTFLISHVMALEDAPRGYDQFRNNQNEWTKVVLKPKWEKGRQEEGRARTELDMEAGVAAGPRPAALSTEEALHA